MTVNNLATLNRKKIEKWSRRNEGIKLDWKHFYLVPRSDFDVYREYTRQWTNCYTMKRKKGKKKEGKRGNFLWQRERDPLFATILINFPPSCLRWHDFEREAETFWQRKVEEEEDEEEEGVSEFRSRLLRSCLAMKLAVCHASRSRAFEIT